MNPALPHLPHVRVEARNLQVSYDQFVALSCPSLQLSGNVLAIIGHNGAGKSTLIKSMLGLLPPQSGNLNLSLSQESSQYKLVPEEHMAFCPETGSVFADISVESYIKLWCRLKHGDPHFYRKEGNSYIDLLNLEPLLSKYGRELSKGQRRRVQTAIGFLIQPKLFLFDEPFDGLDVQKTSELTEIIHEHRERMCFVISSHRMDVVERLADIIVVLKEGQFLTYGGLGKVCADLCERSLHVRDLKDCEGSLDAFKSAFPETLFTLVGDRIIATGHGMKEETFKAFLAQRGENTAQVGEARPSLVDAMNFHLRCLGQTAH